MRAGRRRGLGLASCLMAVLLATPALAAGTLRIGLQDDPELLDPARSGGLPDRVVLAALCDKLIDTDASGGFVPQLATAWEWSADALALTLTLRPSVRFHDGTAMDADAVRENLDRYRANPRSVRRGELKAIAAVEAVDPHTVRIRLSEPYAPLIAVLADRAGMMLSPSQIRPLGEGVATGPVCAGPFRFTERVAQDRIVLDRFPEYWNAGEITLDRVVYRPFPDSTVRLANLKAGALDMIERLGPTDVADVRSDRRLRLLAMPSIAYRTLSINVAAGEAAKKPLGRDPRVRAAFEAALDREVINQVALEGAFRPANQFEPAGTRYWNPAYPVPRGDAAKARALLKEAGFDRVALTLSIANNPVDQQTGTVIQSMAAEAGFDVTLRTAEAVSGVEAARRGDYEATLVIWSGRADPDGNAAIWVACGGFLNWGKYCNPRMDQLLDEGRRLIDAEQRAPIYREITDILQRDRPHLVLYNPTWLWGLSEKLDGFVPQPDGLIRLQGVRLRP